MTFVIERPKRDLSIRKKYGMNHERCGVESNNEQYSSRDLDNGAWDKAEKRI